MSNHTPGPWECDPELDIRDDGGDILASVNCESGQLTSTDCANCRLIAAAPDLLDACRDALSHVAELREAWRTGAITERDNCGGTRSNRNVTVEIALRTAIAKAEGAA